MNEVIPGIYNYCDRWCEHCPCAQRCEMYGRSDEQTDGASTDFDARAFSESLTQNIHGALEMIRESVEKRGLDWEQFHQEALQQELAQPELTRMQQAVKSRGIQYGTEAKKWLEQNQAWLSEKERELQATVNLGIDQRMTIRQLSEAIEIIQWYNFFIGPRIGRAIRGLHERVADVQDLVQNDANGSAKITLIAIERSLAAWEILRSHFPERTDDLLDLFRLLASLRRETLKLFPNAMDFVRPGFDEVGVPVRNEY